MMPWTPWTMTACGVLHLNAQVPAECYISRTVHAGLPARTVTRAVVRPLQFVLNLLLASRAGWLLLLVKRWSTAQ